MGYKQEICDKLDSFGIGSIVQFQTMYGDQESDDNWLSFGSYGVIMQTIMTTDKTLCTAKVYWFDDQSVGFVCGSQLRFVC